MLHNPVFLGLEKSTGNGEVFGEGAGPVLKKISLCLERMMRSLVILTISFLVSVPSAAREVRVTDVSSLLRAIKVAQPADRIVLQPGRYRLNKILITRPGAAEAPITVTALNPAQTQIETNAVELFKLDAPYWVFENLDIRGSEKSHHAFHIVGRADHTVLRGNHIVGFHASVKGNPQKNVSPDNVVITGNAFYNDAPRKTAEPVTLIDVVGGDKWKISENFIADFGKDGGNRISYGAFLKGGGKGGIFERNLVVCEWRNKGLPRVGLSFGGGGTFQCTGPDCPLEHKNGVMQNNVIINCPEAPGVYINRSRDISIHHNTIFSSWGILLRFQDTFAKVQNNIMSGAVSLRRGADVKSDDNIQTGYSFIAYIPIIARKLKERISDYDVKYDSWIEKADVIKINSTIDGVTDWLSKSSLGRGDEVLKSLFRNPGQANFSLREGVAPPTVPYDYGKVQTDFCGRERGKVIFPGAIDFSAGPCDVLKLRNRILNRFGIRY
ncbi:MAG: hypothetical protein GKS01_09245 [Alphaproteobacteria bacterium]|nr:hypothetical protein [Alphaproteobacteria bacterium]